MKLTRYVIATLGLCVSVHLSAQIPDQFSSPIESKLTRTNSAELFEAYLDGVMAVQFDTLALAGMTVSVIKDGQPFLLKGYGYANLEKSEEVDPSRHLFRPGSVSKLFTWTAIMQLVEQGKIDLDAAANDYLYQLALPDNFDKPVTLKHIMSHAAGFEDGGAGYLFADSVDDLKSLSEVLTAYMPEQVREPGTYSAYSNYATAVAGLIVANVSGLPFEEYISRYILAPLEMNHSTFQEPLPTQLAADLAVGYAERSGVLNAVGFEFLKNFAPAGALSATAEDMTKFMLAHINEGEFNGKRLLGISTTNLMHSQLFSHHPAVDGMAYGFYEISRNNMRFVGHGGDTFAFHSQLMIQPDDKFGFFISLNSPAGATARDKLISAIIEYFYPQGESVRQVTGLEGGAERLAEMVGAYRVNRRSYTKLEGITELLSDVIIAPVDDGVIIDGLGRFSEIEPYVLQARDGSETVAFETDESGKITHAFINSIPYMVLDKLPFLQQARLHLAVIVLSLIAALVLITNQIRNRGELAPIGAELMARRSLTGAAGLLLLFIVGVFLLALTNQVDTLIYDFPPSGTSLLLLLPILFVVMTTISIVLTVPLWWSGTGAAWPRVRYTTVALLFLALVLVLNFWNVLGWNYF